MVQYRQETKNKCRRDYLKTEDRMGQKMDGWMDWWWWWWWNCWICSNCRIHHI